MGQDISSETLREQTYRKISFKILPLIMACYILSLIERSSIGVGKIQFEPQLGFTEAQYGFGAGIFYLAFMTMEIPSNYYMLRVGARKTLVRVMVLWAPFCAALALMTQPWHFYLFRILLGAAEAGFFPGALLYITFWIPAARRARFIAVLMSGVAISGLVGGPFGGWVMHAFDGAAGLRGWQWLFIVEGAPALVLAAIVYLVLDDRPEDAKWLSSEQKMLIARDLEAEHKAKSAHAHSSFRAVITSPRFISLGAMGIAVNSSVGALFFWLPTIIRDSGVQGVLNVGLLSAAPFVVGIIVQFAVAKSSDRSGERRWHASISATVAAIGWLALSLVGSEPVPALIALTLVTSGSLAIMGPFWSLPSSLLAGTAAAGGIALVTSIATIGSFISPMIVGLLASTSGSLVLGQYYYAAVLLTAALLLVSVRHAADRTVHTRS